jgi:chitodextrinase/regulation of enolase protein 1 (concanavalin A-like superfamily)
MLNAMNTSTRALLIVLSCITSGAMAQNWDGVDIGPGGAQGSTVVSTASVRVSGAGTDIGGTADEMHFAYVAMSGNIDIAARLPELIRPDATQTKAGLMVRASLAANAAHAYSFIRSAGYAGFIFRSSSAGASTTIAGPRVTRPGWFRLTRVGNTFTAYTGQDGLQWTEVGQASIAMPATVFVGMAVTSRVKGSLATATFDNIALSGAANDPDTTPPSIPLNLRTTSVSWSAVTLGWDASSDTASKVAGYRIYRDGSATPIGTTASTQYTDANVVANTSYTYGVTAVDTAAAANESAQAGPLQITTPAASVNTPDVVGMTQAAAEQEIGNAGLTVGSVITQISATVAAGRVISQQPAGGTAVSGSTAINLVVSSGSGAPPPATAQPLVLAASSDVGNATPAGSMLQMNGTLVISGSGLDIGGVQDQMHFGYVQLSGDVDVAARLPDFVRPHSTMSKAGIMIRESLAADSRHAYSYIRSAGYAGLISRAAAGGTSVTVDGPRVSRPAWMRLRRVGNEFTAFTSADGTSWTQVAQVTVSISSALYVGLAVTSRVEGALATATFDNATISRAQSAAIATPNVLGQPRAAAESAIQAAGLALGSIAQHDSASVPQGNVISQNPSAGSSVTPGTAVDLVISSGPPPDRTPPSVPPNLRVTGTTGSTVALAWSPSVDSGGAGLAGYRIFRNGSIVPIETTTNSSYTDTGRTPNTLYSYTVVAFDNATPPNESDPAGPVTGTTTGTPPTDMTPPSVPQSLQVTGTTTETVSLSWQTSNDTGGSGLAGYRVYRQGTTMPIGTPSDTTFTDTARAAATAYSYRVSAIDNAGNESAQSASAIGITQAPSGSCTVTITGGEALMNVGQLAAFTANVTGGTAPITYQWSVGGPIIRDYQESTSALWAAMQMQPADFQNQSISFYWKPMASQIHPLNTGPVNRDVSVSVQAGAASCSSQIAISVERNSTNINRQAEDIYTSNHPGAGNLGRVRNDHSSWHRDWMPGVANYGVTFFDFHREFVDRFNSWRQEFGYPPVQAWNPGTPLPTGPDVNHGNRLANYVLTPPPAWFSAIGSSAARPNNGTACDTVIGQRSLLEFADRNALGCAVNKPLHSDVHNRVGGHMATTSGAPVDPIFWRWHEFMDTISQEWLAGGDGSASLAIPPQEQRLAAGPSAILEIVAASHEHLQHQIAHLALANEENPALDAEHDHAAGHPAQTARSTAHDHHTPAASTAGPNVALLREDQPDAVVKHRGRATRGPRIIYEAPFRTRPFVTDLPTVTVKFSVPVFGLTADALSVNGSQATHVTGSGAGPYVFTGFNASREVLAIKFNGRKVRDAEGNRGGNRSWQYWTVKAGEDRDRDGLDDAEEVQQYMTNPRLRDTDADGMPDGLEAHSTCLNPFEDERSPHDMAGGTLPGNDDQDGDGITDLQEYYFGSDPCSP